MLDEKFMVRRFLNGAGDALAMLRTEDEDAQDQYVERALHQGQAVAASGRHLT